ncbi:hypothetical protein [Bacillus sp. AFS037270]|uniref:hypothetical protein n=1 Tax=Bacillus sp. AFS037270 TaxID=2033499 RepID=UPI000BFCDAAB|nr:hypothetical protein [Bacillus sp. AFS037270]PGV52472.1 hypothetical protein COD92_09740 [Bacillus sp. AFS037270]
MNNRFFENMADENSSDREIKIAEYLTENAPDDELSHVLAYAHLKQTYQVSQAEYQKLTGVNERTLRTYISRNRKEYEEQLEASKPTMQIDPDKLQSALTEEEFDQFIATSIQKAIGPDSTVADRKLVIEMFGIKAEDIKSFNQIKNRSLKWHIKNNLSKLSQVLDTRQLGIMLQESPYLYHADRESKGNSQRFIDTSLEDESFKLELMYWGMVFVSMYNSNAHPDLDLLANAVRINRLENGIKEPMNMSEVKAFAKGKDIEKTAPKKATKAEIESLLKQLEKEFGEEYSHARKTVKGVVKSPEFPEVEEIEAKSSKYFNELLVLTSVEEELEYLFNGKLKINNI